jgi:heterodisulfide reductase subunit C
MAGPTPALRARVLELTGENSFHCYQCGNCSAGCPVAGRADLLPHQVFRLLQIGGEENDRALLRSVQPWLCVGCQTCATRCPQELDLSKVMDAIRAEATRAKCVPPAARRMEVFNRTFVEQVMASGRLSEVQLGIFVNLRNRNPLENATALPALMKRGKLKPFAKRITGLNALRRGRKP